MHKSISISSDGSFERLPSYEEYEELSVNFDISPDRLNRFININKLTINNTDLINLDLSMLNNLEFVDCSSNNLSSLILNNNIKKLLCNDNMLTELILHNNLEILNCSDNIISELILNEKLRICECKNNLLQILIPNKNLSRLNCENNLLTNFHCNENLTQLACTNNKIHTLLFNEKLTHCACENNSFNILKLNHNLEWLCCNNLKILYIDKKLKCLFCSYIDNIVGIFELTILQYFNCTFANDYYLIENKQYNFAAVINNINHEKNIKTFRQKLAAKTIQYYWDIYYNKEINNLPSKCQMLQWKKSNDYLYNNINLIDRIENNSPIYKSKTSPF